MLQNICECAAVDYGSSDHLIIIFSSKPAMRRDVFDYVTFAEALPHTKLYLRDGNSDYLYHTGVSGLTTSVDETVDFLRFFIRRIKPARTTIMGISGGGYGAILHGHLIGKDPRTRIDDINVQAPVTYVLPETRERLGGGERIPGLFQNVTNYVTAQGINRDYLDLSQVLAGNPDSVRLLRLYYPVNNQIDALHAQNLMGFPHVQVVPHQSQSHILLGATLSRDGTLYRDLGMSVEDLIRVNPPPGPVPEAIPAPLGLDAMAARQA